MTTESESGTVIEQLKDAEGSFYFLMAEEDKIKTEVRTQLEREQRRMEEQQHNYYDMGEEYHGYDNFGTQPHFPQQPHNFSAEQQRLEEDRMYLFEI